MGNYRVADLATNCKARLMNKVVLTLSLIFLSTPGLVLAQGLKGSPKSCNRSASQLAYVSGNSDKERWQKFISVQPKLIGMTFDEVDKALCGKPVYKQMSEAEYGLTQEPLKGKIKGWLHLRVYFRDGFAWKYAVEASS